MDFTQRAGAAGARAGRVRPAAVLFLVLLVPAGTLAAVPAPGTFRLGSGQIDIDFGPTSGCSPITIEGLRRAALTVLDVTLGAASGGVVPVSFAASWNAPGATTGSLSGTMGVDSGTGSRVFTPGEGWSSGDLQSLDTATSTLTQVAPASGLPFAPSSITSTGSGTPEQISVTISLSGSSAGFSPCIDMDITITATLVRVVAPAAVDDNALQPTSKRTQTRDLDNFARRYPVNPHVREVLRQGPAGTAGTGLTVLDDGAELHGLAAGGPFGLPWGAWVSYQYSQFSDDFAATAFDADGHMVFGGLDLLPSQALVVGIAFGYETTDVDSSFNAGGEDIDGFTVAPYLGVLLAGAPQGYSISADLSAGYSSLDIDQFRTAPGTTTRVSSSTDGERWFVTGNATVSRAFGALRAAGRLGLFYASDDQHGFVERNPDGTVAATVGGGTVELGRLVAGADLAWTWGAFEPYAGGDYEYDFQRDDLRVTGTAHPNDDDDVRVRAGLRWFGARGISATLEYATVSGREDFDEESVLLLLRWEE